jgi:hypothetical protein
VLGVVDNFPVVVQFDGEPKLVQFANIDALAAFLVKFMTPVKIETQAPGQRGSSSLGLD